MSWLACDGTVLASLEVADTHRTRLKGLLGRPGIEGAMLLRPARSVHTIGLRFSIDVAWCDEEMVVLRTATVGRNRITRPVWASVAVIEAEAGSFERWGLRVGDQLDISP